MHAQVKPRPSAFARALSKAGLAATGDRRAGTTRKSGVRLRLPQLVGLATALGGAFASYLWISISCDLFHQEQRTRVLSITTQAARLIESRLNATLAPAETLAVIARNSNQLERHFNVVSNDLLRSNPYIEQLSLAPGGVIRMIAPHGDNEVSLGFNPLTDSEQSAEGQLAKANTGTTVAGPLDLIQGGRGIVGRIPVFRPAQQGGEQFWGFSSVTLRLPALLGLLRLDSLSDAGLDYQLWRDNPVSGEREIIAASRETLNGAPVEQSLYVPNARWQLAVMPRDGWPNPPWLAGAIALGVLFSLLAGCLGRTFVELRSYRSQLSRKVEQRTRELDGTLERYHSLITASQTGLWEYNINEGKLVCQAGYLDMLGYQCSDLPEDSQGNWLEFCRHLIHPDDIQRTDREVNSYLQGGCQGQLEVQFRMRHRQGHWVSILSRGSALRSAAGSGGVTVVAGTHIDISHLVNTTSQLKLALHVMDSTREGLLITDPEYRLVATNRAFLEISGYSEDECIGQPATMLSEGMHTPDFLHTIMQRVSEDGFWQGEIWGRRKNGETAPLWISITAVRDEHGTLSHYIGVVSDITLLKQSQAEVQRLAYFDALTGLPNRAMLQDRSEYALKLARQGKRPLAVLVLDLDNFKNINDSLGQDTGDRVLQQCASRLTESLRDQDALCRLGGDEFALLLPNTDADTAAHTARRLLERLGSSFRLLDRELAVSCSIGIAMFPNDGDTLSQLHTNADTAMYRAKQQGRNTYCFYTPEMQARCLRQLTVENALRRAMEKQQLSLNYQVQLQAQDRQLIGLEALLRWRHPELGQVPPGEFIPVAESSGLILPLSNWVLREVSRQLRAWLDEGLDVPRIAVNLSAAQFRQPDLPELVLSVLEEFAIPAHYLELELTESMAMENPDLAAQTIQRLHQAGIGVAIDDFGTGYSSMSQLKHFRISTLKIDRSFVNDLVSSSDDQAVVGTILNLARSLDLRCVAEGVETREQLDYLCELGCDRVQGFYLGRPMNAEQTRRFLAHPATH
ncbi:bifunctional diguanylate cyclase/phosphodiesterase [Parahaliea aestuarii]|uniref:cyclic-guanylate-specific phosphodiesterase n=1 Tax=Parahaliea aestuarii TaxID=1852021 RepID=A0A5C9A219_9GAMM|nr:EAL domain-containing protein [Parahaliea aestuarii]TXS94766.1 EAL domain-containing protein [Parahaliea aestuarii]